MKSIIFFAALVCAPFTFAQYISEGWKPGQQVTQGSPAPAHTPGAQYEAVAEQQSQQPASKSSSSFFDITRILESGPVSQLLGKAGINITDQLAAARAKASPWDERIPLITDDNWDDMVGNETLTAEEEEKGIWFLIITATNGGPAGGMSKGLDEQFDAAYNITQTENDLPFVNWGRIDYYNVTYLTTKWNIWQAPYLMVSRDRGQTLFFYKANNIKLDEQILRNFLLEETWRTSTPWKSSLAPGGQFEIVMHYWAIALRKIYDVAIVIPRWVMMLISGGIASVVMRFLHRNPAAGVAYEDQKKEEDKAKIEPATAPTATTTATPAKSKGSSKQKKSGKK